MGGGTAWDAASAGAGFGTMPRFRSSDVRPRHSPTRREQKEALRRALVATRTHKLTVFEVVAAKIPGITTPELASSLMTEWERDNPGSVRRETWAGGSIRVVYLHAVSRAPASPLTRVAPDARARVAPDATPEGRKPYDA